MPGNHNSEPIGLYLHIPFCLRKCPYCDFNTYAGLESQFDDTVDAICAELRMQARLVEGREVATVFLGGGTPTVLNAAQLTRLLAAVHEHYQVRADAEITSEANPGAVDRATFGVLRTLGVNRLSLGVQSFQPDELAFLGRIHGVEDVYTAIAQARQAGIDNINLDLMFGLPHQEPALWSDSLDQALALELEHLSLYSLIVEEKTPLFQWVENGRVDAPDDDLAADLYEMAMARLAANYVQYEVSNWARRQPGEAVESSPERLPQRASRHNLTYWLNGEYIGVGPGAHSHLRVQAGGQTVSRRWGNRRAVPGYVRRMRAGQPVEEFHEEIAGRSSMGETMMLGLRLVQHGVTRARFARLHGADLHKVYTAEIAELSDSGLIHSDAVRVWLTPRGLMLGNQVFARFVADEGGESETAAEGERGRIGEHIAQGAG